VVTLLALGMLLAGCAQASTPVAPGAGNGVAPSQPATPKRLVAATMSDPKAVSSNDVVAGSGTIQGGDALEDLVNAGMVVIDNKGKLHAQLAEAVPSLENGLWKLLPDGRMEMTWHIREGAQWHDGTPFTPDDLIFSTALARDRDLPLFREPAADLIESIQAPDARTVVVTWKQPFIQADTVFGRRIIQPRPRHIFEQAYTEAKDTVTGLPYWTTGYVGTGPYKVREWTTGAHVVLEANDRFVLGRPKIDQIEVRFIPSPDTLAANILAGEVQLTLGRNLSLAQALQIRDQWQAGHVGVGYKNWIAAYPQLMNPSQPALLANVELRRALLYALDRQQLVETLQAGIVPVADSILPPSDPAYPLVQNSIVRYGYDPARAAQIVQGLGYAKGADGVYRDGAGQALNIQVQTSADDDAQVAGNLALADAWKQFGLASESYLLPQAQRNDREVVANYPGVRVWRQPNDIDDLRRYSSNMAPMAENRFQGGNRSRYQNPALDGIIDRYMTTIPLDQRMSVLGEVLHHLTDQVVVMGLWYNTEPVEISNRLINVNPRDAGQTTEAWNAHEWDLQ
jgi:peptide/nickel transport system substrate-binding protein